MEKKVSLIMPLYNAEDYVEQAIESILNQTYQNFELILIDDIPTDSTIEKVSRFQDERIQLVHNHKNSGIAASRNRGLEFATGDYIALMDDDDISMPERFEKQVAFLNEHPEIDFLGGKYQYISQDGTVLSESKIAYNNPLYIKALFLFQNIYSNGEMMFRREVVEKNKIRYSERQYGMEDFKFWIECSKVGNFSTIEDVVFQHRVHEQSETIKTKTQKTQEREEHRKALLKYSMKLSNIVLPQEEFEMVYRYTNNQSCSSSAELKKYYYALADMVKQAKDVRLGFVKELDNLCRKFLMYQVRQAENIWEAESKGW